MVVGRDRKLSATSLAGIGMIFVGMFTMALAGLGVSVAGAVPVSRVPAGKHWCPRAESSSASNASVKGAIATPHGGEQGCESPPTTCSTTTSTTQPGTTTSSTSTTSSTTTSTTSTTIDTTTTTTSVTNGTTTSTTTGPGDSTTTSSSTPGDDTTTSTTGPVGNIVGQGGPGTPIGTVIPGGVHAQAGSGTLPRTGSSLVILLGIGGALVASGIGLVARRRRWANR